MPRFIDDLKRSHYCGVLRASDIGQEVVLFGWVAKRRDHGGCIFIDLRDREGLAQIVFDPTYQLSDQQVKEATRLPALVDSDVPLWDAADAKRAHEQANDLRREWVLGVRGVVVHRGDGKENPKLPSGAVEVRVSELWCSTAAETPPFMLDDEINTDEEVRLRYRYLDLRRGPLQRALRLRHTVNQTTRSFLTSHGCMELETPILCKYTPGGARNFLVPSRLSPGQISTPWRRVRSCLSSCLWWPVLTSTSKS